MKTRAFLPLILIVVLALACAPLNWLNNPTPAPTEPVPPSPTLPPLLQPTATFTPPPTPTAEPTALSDKLSPAGPWLIYPAEDGLWAANA